MELLFQAAAWPGFPQAAHPLSAGRAVLDAAVGQGCLCPFLSEGPRPGLTPNHSHMTLITCRQLPRQDAVPPSSAIQWGFGAGGGSRGK